MAEDIVHSTSDHVANQSTTNSNKKDRPRNHYTTVKMAPCRVCGGTSTGYHFGVVSCEACKAFFRRAIGKESYGQYVCQKGNNCAQTPRKISSCCACRFKRCLETGMSKGGVRRGRYSIELRTKSILDAQRVENEQLVSEGTINGRTHTQIPDLPKHCNTLFSHKKQSKSGILDQNTHTNTVPYKHDIHIPTSSSQNPREFPWKQKSDLFKFQVDDTTVLNSDINLTKQDYSLMKAMFEGYTLCESSDCLSFSENDMMAFVESSTVSGTDMAYNQSNVSLNDLDLLANSLSEETPFDEYSETFNAIDLTLPASARFEEYQLMDRIIQKLLALQRALYPHHKVTEDILQKQTVIQTQHQQREEAFLCMFGSTEYASSDDFKDVLSEVNIELDDRLIRFREKGNANEASIVQYIYHSKFIPGFKHLDKTDVSNILKASYSEFWLFGNFATMNEEKGVSGGTDVVINAHKKVLKTFFPKDWVDAIFQFAETLQKLELTVEEVALIRVIVLTFIDRCPLKEPEKVDKLNQLFIRCLQYYLSKSTRNPSCRFYKIFDRLIAVRTLMHTNKKVNETFLKEWGFLMADFPLWREMMISQLPHLQRRGNHYFTTAYK